MVYVWDENWEWTGKEAGFRWCSLSQRPTTTLQTQITSLKIPIDARLYVHCIRLTEKILQGKLDSKDGYRCRLEEEKDVSCITCFHVLAQKLRNRWRRNYRMLSMIYIELLDYGIYWITNCLVTFMYNMTRSMLISNLCAIEFMFDEYTPCAIEFKNLKYRLKCTLLAIARAVWACLLFKVKYN